MVNSPDVPVGDVFLQATGLAKSFAGVQALRDVSLDVRCGEVHAVVGENGAGKSTLMKILAGLLSPDAGSIAIGGAPCRLTSAHAAAGQGIAMIHQELLPVPELSVEENVLLGREPVRGPGGWVDRRQLRRRAVEVLGRLNPRIRPGQRMGDLSVAEMQTVEIARALAGHARLIIMDEPTSALSDREVEALLRLVGELKMSGVAVLYITHRLEEVFRVADRVTVLRDGARVATLPSAGLSTERLIPLMVGREVGDAFPRIESTPGEVLLEVNQLGRRGLFGGVSFSVRAGEVVGLAGLMGAGRSEVLRAIYGLEPADEGGLWLRGRSVRIRRPQDALAQGIVLVTEDRQRDGIVPTLGVRENLTLSSLARCCRSGWVDAAAERRVAERSVSELGIRTRGLDLPVKLLSGGNQQKVLLGRALLAEPKVLLLDEPTRGIDIGAKLEVYRLMAALARRGMGVVLVSSELPELMALSHRLVVLREGRQVKELDIRRTTADEVMRWAVAGAARVEGVVS